MTCSHRKNIYPVDEEKSLRKDAIVGWVVDVKCGECGLTGVAPVDCTKVDWDEPTKEAVG